LNQEAVEATKAESIYSLTLACTYSLLAMISSFQLGKIIFNRHNLASFHVLFVSLSFLWTTNRAVFFCTDVEWTAKSFFAMLWIADDLELTTYVLLLVFYIYWIQDEDASSSTPSAETRRVRLVVNVVYGGVVFCMFTKTIVMIAWCHGESCKIPSGGKDSLFEHWFDTFLLIWYTGLFLLYSWIFVMVQGRLCRQRSKDDEREQFSRHGTYENRMVGVRLMMTFWVIFATHMVYSCVKKVGLWNIEISVDSNSRKKKIKISMFLLLILWEIVPTSLVLWVFRSIPSTNVAGCTFWSKNWHHYPGDYSSDRTWPRKQRGKKKTHRRGRASSDSELTLSQSQVFYSSNSLVWSSSLRYSPPMLNNPAAQCLDETQWNSSPNVVRKEKRLYAQNLAPDRISPNQLKVPEV